MRKLFSFGVVFMLVFSSCNGDNKNGENDAMDSSDSTALSFEDMNEISLMEYGLNMTLMLPEVASSTGASIEPKISHEEGDYVWTIAIGSRFELIIEDYGKEKDRVVNEKKRLEDLASIFDVEILKDEPNLIMYKRTLHEGQGGKPSYHCYGEILIDGYTFILRSNDEGSLRPIIEDMVKTIQSAKVLQLNV